MVRTKADAASRVAAGGKAPKKSLGRTQSSPLPSSSDKVGKDNLPGNRYCPRETPEWQKKITFFYDKNNENESSTSTQNCETSNKNTKDKLKRENSEIDKTDEKTENESVSSPKKSKNSADVESNVDGTSAVNESEEDLDESMETEE